MGGDVRGILGRGSLRKLLLRIMGVAFAVCLGVTFALASPWGVTFAVCLGGDVRSLPGDSEISIFRNEYLYFLKVMKP